MADSNDKTAGSDRTNLSEQSMRSLSNSVGSLAQQVRNMTTNSAKLAARGLSAGAGSVISSGKDLNRDFGADPSKSLGVGVASAINPFAGELIRKIVEKNRGALGNSVKGMLGASKSMFGLLKNKLADRRPTEAISSSSSRATMSQIESLKKARAAKADLAASGGGTRIPSSFRVHCSGLNLFAPWEVPIEIARLSHPVLSLNSITSSGFV